MAGKGNRLTRPALGIEKEVVKEEISTALHDGVEN